MSNNFDVLYLQLKNILRTCNTTFEILEIVFISSFVVKQHLTYINKNVDLNTEFRAICTFLQF